MTNSATLAVRIDPFIKNSASKVAKERGLDLATAVRMFVTQISREKRIPVDIAKPTDLDLAGETYLEHVKQSVSQIDNGEWAYHELIEV
ncbi:MAG: type II toxin-antitoxin system RelB/DinJ family antitoxin [Candidatus Ancillula sp.]|jgi:DNA-damage-inducible protein J|nr:type II toxin-antitoxin system RelB/DinJ family antitoxin [Candidatus Ancillula sp.]